MRDWCLVFLLIVGATRLEAWLTPTVQAEERQVVMTLTLPEREYQRALESLCAHKDFLNLLWNGRFPCDEDAPLDELEVARNLYEWLVRKSRFDPEGDTFTIGYDTWDENAGDWDDPCDIVAIKPIMPPLPVYRDPSRCRHQEATP